jgi:saccharopine dehydrogenase-like NADP-dependent oxidoreductase
MRNILLMGAGKSATSLIRYILDQAIRLDVQLTIADQSEEQARKKLGNHPSGRVLQLDVNNANARQRAISEADVVISMLPATLHMLVAADCLNYGKHLATASYVSEEMQALHEDVKARGLVFINEAGLDPGIDHMSAMKMMHEIDRQGGKIVGFQSYCGGLVAPKHNTNLWGYKFSWNPRNVILAGQGLARFKESGGVRFRPYQQLFVEAETLDVAGAGQFDAYPNRDSLAYEALYGLKSLSTLIRGTLRMPGFCKAWHAWIAMGFTDDQHTISIAENTYRALCDALLPMPGAPWKSRVERAWHGPLPDGVFEKLEETGVFSERPLPFSEATPAAYLQALLETEWKLQTGDQDRVVMHHILDWEKNGKTLRWTSSLDLVGEDDVHTAMAQTVGLPLAMSVELLLENKVPSCGVLIPVEEWWYGPILKKLEGFGIRFTEHCPAAD